MHLLFMPKMLCIHSMSECLYFWFLIIILNLIKNLLGHSVKWTPTSKFLMWSHLMLLWSSLINSNVRFIWKKEGWLRWKVVSKLKFLMLMFQHRPASYTPTPLKVLRSKIGSQSLQHWGYRAPTAALTAAHCGLRWRAPAFLHGAAEHRRDGLSEFLCEVSRHHPHRLGRVLAATARFGT